jgi:hypothetical protein
MSQDFEMSCSAIFQIKKAPFLLKFITKLLILLFRKGAKLFPNFGFMQKMERKSAKLSLITFSFSTCFYYMINRKRPRRSVVFCNEMSAQATETRSESALLENQGQKVYFPTLLKD